MFILSCFQVWGVEIASGNAVNWLECVARDKQVTLKPIARENDDLVSAVLLHLPQAKVTCYLCISNWALDCKDNNKVLPLS